MGGRRLIAAGGTGANEVRIFDAATLSTLGKMDLPHGVYGLDFSHNGRTLAIAGGDSILRVVHVTPHGGIPTSGSTDSLAMSTISEGAAVHTGRSDVLLN